MHQSKAEWQQADSENGHQRKRHNADRHIAKERKERDGYGYELELGEGSVIAAESKTKLEPADTHAARVR